MIYKMAAKCLSFKNSIKSLLTNPNSKLIGQKLEYAFKRLSYYLYFLERFSLGKNMNLRGVADVTNLQKYGKDYIEYKYRFC